MDIDSALNSKQFFRFTGPPEHWLTALKYMTWGLSKENLSSWKKIQTGDVFFIHSTQASVFPNAVSGIIGIGVIGYYPSIKDNNLWHYEIKNNENKWPFLVPLSEIYLFSEVQDPSTWDSPEPSNDSRTVKLIDQLLKNRIPTSQIKRFPVMGSFSKVSFEVARQILFQKRPLYLYSGHSRRGEVMEEKSSDLSEVHNAAETLRSAASLRFVEQINKRIILKPYSIIERDNDILARAEFSHYSICQSLIDIFKSKGYATLCNKFIDLFAYNEKRSFLFEVKSTENKNFRSQARKGIVQLYEYDYFEIDKFKKEKNINFQDQYRILVPSREPSDKEYVGFINSLDLGIAMSDGKNLKPIGKDLGFSRI